MGGRDLQRDEQGTWLGITKQGRLAVLTNFREEGTVKLEARSRGAMVNAFLTQPANDHATTETFVHDLVADDGLKGVGGFSLVCGKVGQPMAVISNRTPNVEGITWISAERNETVGLSNAAFADRSWPKILRGELLLSLSVQYLIDRGGSEADLVDDLFEILSNDTLPKRPRGVGWESFLKELRKSIFIPAIGGEDGDDMSAEDIAAADGGECLKGENAINLGGQLDGQSDVYGTQKQTVVLVSRQGRVTFVERTLYDEFGKTTQALERDRTFTFNIEGWSYG